MQSRQCVPVYDFVMERELRVVIVALPRHILRGWPGRPCNTGRGTLPAAGVNHWELRESGTASALLKDLWLTSRVPDVSSFILS